ncbi:MAG: hypothetical protein ACMUFK_04180 [Thermoplasmatota archaeon]
MKNKSYNVGSSSPSEDEKVLRTIEDLRSEVRELRNMVNMLMDILVSLETHDDLDLEMEPNMMGYDDLLKSGHYCM